MSNTPPLLLNNPFGTDLATIVNTSGDLDLDPSMFEASGRDVLAQSLARRQLTPLGSVIDSPNDCFDLRQWLSEGMTNAQIKQLASIITNELKKDQRVTDAVVGVTYTQATNTLTVIENITSGYGPFTLTLAISQVTVSILMSNT